MDFKNKTLLHGFHTNGNQWKAGYSYVYNRESILSNKDCKKGQRRVLYNDKGVNPTREYNIYDPKCEHPNIESKH